VTGEYCDNNEALSWLYAELEWRHTTLVRAIQVLERSPLRSKIKRHFIKAVPVRNVVNA
jgi:hypothetical protein